MAEGSHYDKAAADYAVMFIESLCAPIGPKSIMAAVLICYILYLLLSMLIQHMMSTKRIAQLYSE